MTSNARGGGRILGSLRSENGKGVVRLEDRCHADIDDLWSALTDPARLSVVDIDLWRRLSEQFQVEGLLGSVPGGEAHSSPQGQSRRA